MYNTTTLTKFSSLKNMRTYSIELKECNYPKFDGKYNIYIGVFGQLTGEFLHNIDSLPIASKITKQQAIDLQNILIEKAENVIFTH